MPNIPPEVMQQLSGLTNVPLVRFAARYWWVTVPLGYAGWAKYQERKKKGEATLPNIIADLSPLIGVVATLVMLNHTLSQREAAVPPIVPAGPVRDADFSTNSKPVAGIGAPRAA
jgi:hypothetical protein